MKYQVEKKMTYFRKRPALPIQDDRGLVERLVPVLRSGSSEEIAGLTARIRELRNPPVEAILGILMSETGPTVSRMGEEDDRKYAGRRSLLTFSLSEPSLMLIYTLSSLIADIGERAIPAIIQVVHGKWINELRFNPGTHEGIMVVLEKMGRSILPHLLTWLDGDCRAAAEAAAYTLRHFPEETVMNALVATNVLLRQNTIINLSYVANHSLAYMARSHFPQIREFLNSSDEQIRRGGIVALARSNHPDAVPVLGEHFSRERYGCNKSLLLQEVGTLKDKRAVELFQAAAASDDAVLRSFAITGLQLLGENVGTVERLIERATHQDFGISADAIEALGEHRDPKALPVLLNALTHPRARIRNQALLALGKIGDTRSVEPMLRCLMNDRADEEEPPGCSMSWYCLEGLGFAVVGPLMQILESPNPKHVANATEILGRIKTTLALPNLIKVLNSREWLVRCRAVSAVALIHDERAEDLLERMSTDPDPRVASEAARCLVKIRAERKHIGKEG
jgi:HEAT repeat protein